MRALVCAFLMLEGRATSSTLVLLDHASCALTTAPNHEAIVGGRLILMLDVVAISKLVRVLNLLIEHLLNLLFVLFAVVFCRIVIFTLRIQSLMLFAFRQDQTGPFAFPNSTV